MSKQRLSTIVAAIAATVAIAAPIAQAAPPRPDDRGLARGAAVAMPDLIDRAIERQMRATSSPDLVDRAVTRLRAPDVHIAAPASSPEAGFAWGAAGIGASTIAAAVLLAAAAMRIARRSRMRSAAVS